MTSQPIHSNVVPSEVGWQFVPQYYTYVNKQPQRLHCFYTKSSTFIHGTEGEDGKPAFGQQEIHNRITAIGFEDCKVFIHSVDAQSSANGGIIIQVIGEMSNRGEAWKKFVQTFFLAEQPNGYFVLNDIFRFLKEETAESEEEREDEEASADEKPAASPVPEPAPVPTPPQEPIPEPVEGSPFTPVLELEPEPEPVPEPHTNGDQTPVVVEPESAPEPEPTPAEKSPAPPSATLTPEQPSTPAPEPAPSFIPKSSPSPAPPIQQTQSQHPPPQQQVPPQPKTWANLAAANSKKWGSAVAQESRGVSEVPVTNTPPNAPASPSPAPGRDQHPAYIAAQNTSNPHCFVKGVVEGVSDTALRNVITRFGAIKELEIVRNKACAFLEFEKVESAKRAITTSLPHNHGGQGGVKIDDGNLRIFFETKKERGERPVSRPRVGGPGQGVNGGSDGRGGYRGGTRGGRGRGPPKA